MARFNSISDRFKAYESTFKQTLNPRSITIIRIDGKNFSTYTRKLPKPFEKRLFEDLETVTQQLVEKVQGCKIGYYQSDEITLILTDYDNYDTQAFLNNGVQKICSITASMATAYFNMAQSDLQRFAMFDSRVFQVPSVTEAINCLKWRQNDAVRNSIQASARSIYSETECRKKNQSDMQEMIFQKTNDFKEKITSCGWEVDIDKADFNWNDLPDKAKRGITVYRDGNGKIVKEALDYRNPNDMELVRVIIPKLDDYYEL